MSEDNISHNISLEKDDCEDESNTMTLGDILKAEEMLEENAEAVLGPGDDKHCTSNEGYKKRQALYSCLTCTPADSKERAGVCLACSYHCHGDHDLVELFTKRNFKCDCGNSLFKGKCCFLDPAKSGVNEYNTYNHNFEGKYCTCERPYPDPEDEIEDEMLQCIVCEDWFHSRHLGGSVPKDYAEMICNMCTDKLPFLQYYLGFSANQVLNGEEKNDDITKVNVTDNNTLKSSQKIVQSNNANEKLPSKVTDSGNTSIQEPKVNGDTLPSQINDTNGKTDKCQDIKENIPENIISEETSGSSPTCEENGISVTPTKYSECKNEEKNEIDCELKSLQKLPRGSGATYWPSNFRKLLCTCVACMEMYKSLNVPFLPNEEDTVQAYEDEGKERRRQQSENNTDQQSQNDEGLQQILSSMDRVQQMEAILGYNDLKSNLKDFLTKFAENKKVVREEDIHEFFSGMQARKRRRVDVPHNCR